MTYIRGELSSRPDQYRVRLLIHLLQDEQSCILRVPTQLINCESNSLACMYYHISMYAYTGITGTTDTRTCSVLLSIVLSDCMWVLKKWPVVPVRWSKSIAKLLSLTTNLKITVYNTHLPVAQVTAEGKQVLVQLLYWLLLQHMIHSPPFVQHANGNSLFSGDTVQQLSSSSTLIYKYSIMTLMCIK